MAAASFELDTSYYMNIVLDERGLQLEADADALAALAEHVDHEPLPEQPRILLVGKDDDGNTELVAPRDVAFLHLNPAVAPSPRLKDREDIVAALPYDFEESDITRALAHTLDRRRQLDGFRRRRIAGGGLTLAGALGGGLGEVVLSKPVLALPGMALFVAGLCTAYSGAEAQPKEREIPDLDELAPPIKVRPKR